MTTNSTDQPMLIRIIAIIELSNGKVQHTFNHLLDAVRNWRGLGFRFVVDEHLHQEGTITSDLIKDADQLWFFGTGLADVSGTNVPVSLTQLEITAIKQRMDAGVGVFATGDHEDVGSYLCEKIPRVGKMRIWSGPGAPTQSLPGSYDSSISSPYSDVIQIDVLGRMVASQRTAEQDTLPKTIWVAHPDGVPHELMQMPSVDSDRGRIRFLPDHAHEGKLLDYDEKDASGNRVLSIPADFYPSSRPLIVARSIRTVFDANDKPSGATLYPVVSAYEPPPKSGWGNVVVDSTFHHWTDANVLRLRLSPFWLHVEQYAINVATWLLGPVGRNKIQERVKAYLAAVEPGVTPPPADDAESLTEVAKSVAKLLGEQRVVTDSLERILHGSVNDELENLNRLVDQFPALKGKDLRGLHADGNLQRSVLGLELLKLRNGQIK